MPDDWHVVGIDIAPDQLASNSRVNERVLGDLQKYMWPASSFDVIVCWDVLEHLPCPMKALTNLVPALRPQGLLIVGVPNLYSLKGLVTKFTPFAFHEWFYRRVLGSKALKSRQFPTFLRRAIAPGPLRQFAATYGLDVVYDVLYEGAAQIQLRRRHRLASTALNVLGVVSRAASLRRADLNLTDYVLILQRKHEG
jgi:SAM-dependent methyltransferase